MYLLLVNTMSSIFVAEINKTTSFCVAKQNKKTSVDFSSWTIRFQTVLKNQKCIMMTMMSSFSVIPEVQLGPQRFLLATLQDGFEWSLKLQLLLPCLVRKHSLYVDESIWRNQLSSVVIFCPHVCIKMMPLSHHLENILHTFWKHHIKFLQRKILDQKKNFKLNLVSSFSRWIKLFQSQKHLIKISIVNVDVAKFCLLSIAVPCLCSCWDGSACCENLLDAVSVFQANGWEISQGKNTADEQWIVSRLFCKNQILDHLGLK